MWIAHEANVPVLVYSISAGPLLRRESPVAVRDALNAAPTTAITVRDRLGLRLLEDVGVTLDRHTVGFSVREPGPAAPDIDPEQYYALLANAADFLVERFDAEVVFVPMEQYDVQHSHAVVAHMRFPEKAEILRRRCAARPSPPCRTLRRCPGCSRTSAWTRRRSSASASAS